MYAYKESDLVGSSDKIFLPLLHSNISNFQEPDWLPVYIPANITYES